ncbi:Uu.00g094200.m01.CDS01 [Anthostomella pinea]|uniref:Uu.00g094200.m01.CDS01 n=1 Tax=Anthostomella pinea TaxID=933095 RepID=A0AAI8YI87_9PEZI|nr:Uu.00g094200.m01.CDS01 [Anthostomella pinea]
MAGFTFTTSSPSIMNFGRSGYNKDGDNEDDGMRLNFGRSGYNKDGDNEDDGFRLSGRSGYNKDGDDETDKGRSGYN